MSEPPDRLAEEQKSKTGDTRGSRGEQLRLDSFTASKQSPREELRSDIQEGLNNTPPTGENNCSDEVPKHRQKKLFHLKNLQSRSESNLHDIKA